VGTFAYSPEEGTKAASLPGQVPDEVKEERLTRLMELQARISRERGELFIGRTLRVLVEETDPENDLAWGRSYRDAPEVDGMVRIEKSGKKQPRPRDLLPGSLADVTVADADEHDLFARPVFS
jgi:ribosomal protein S12 methylthiotransferase